MHAGNLLTTDPGGPYNFSMLNTQTTEVRGTKLLLVGSARHTHPDHWLKSCCYGRARVTLDCIFWYAAAIAFKKELTDMDIIHFLTNVECLEGQFDTWGTFG